MDVGLSLATANWRDGPDLNVGLAREAERLGFSSVWCEEAYGTDGVSPLAWIGASTTRIGLGSAIWQIPGRTPALAAMTAATLDLLSGGRARIGLGSSGPQVVEGWHGKPFERPVTQTREYIAIVRAILAREGPVTFDGEAFSLPYRGEGGTGLGKPLKLSIVPRSPRIPIYVGAMGPRNVEMTAELADGWLPLCVAPRVFEEAFGESLARGLARAGGGKAPGRGFDVAPMVAVVLDDDLDRARLSVKQRLGFYIGGMGHPTVNFYNRLVRRFGYAEAADEILARFQAGEREAAVAAVPDELVDDVALCGSRERIEALLAPWRASPVTTLILDTADVEAMRVVADCLGTARGT